MKHLTIVGSRIGREAPEAFEATYRAPGFINDALCAEVGGDVFFPDMGASAEPARQICRRCEVQDECLEWALANPESSHFGVWGATTPRQRIWMRKKRGEAA